MDGTNGRILVNHLGDFLIGSRNDLLFFSEDLLHNPALGLVGAVEKVAHFLAKTPPPKGHLRVHFGEAYGGKIGAQAKQYSRGGSVGFRLFDVAEFDDALLEELMAMDVGAISS